LTCLPPEEDDDLAEGEELAGGRWLGGALPVEQIIGRSEQAAVAARRIAQSRRHADARVADDVAALLSSVQ
jgi:hypothetical protein